MPLLQVLGRFSQEIVHDVVRWNHDSAELLNIDMVLWALVSGASICNCRLVEQELKLIRLERLAHLLQHVTEVLLRDEAVGIGIQLLKRLQQLLLLVDLEGVVAEEIFKVIHSEVASIFPIDDDGQFL